MISYGARTLRQTFSSGWTKLSCDLTITPISADSLVVVSWKQRMSGARHLENRSGWHVLLRMDAPRRLRCTISHQLSGKLHQIFLRQGRLSIRSLCGTEHWDFSARCKWSIASHGVNVAELSELLLPLGANCRLALHPRCEWQHGGHGEYWNGSALSSNRTSHKEFLSLVTLL